MIYNYFVDLHKLNDRSSWTLYHSKTKDTIIRNPYIFRCRTFRHSEVMLERHTVPKEVINPQSIRL